MFKRDIDTLYENLLKKYDKEIDKLDKQENRKCSCCKGCSSCCHQLIIITDFEVELLKYTISTLFRKDREKLERKVREQCEILKNNNLTPKTITPYVTEQEQVYIQNKFFNLNLECPFLKNNECSIHSRRQISCMTYRNYGNIEECKNTINVSEAYTFNNIEIDLRKEIYEKTGIVPGGFNVLQFALLEFFEKGEY